MKNISKEMWNFLKYLLEKARNFYQGGNWTKVSAYHFNVYRFFKVFSKFPKFREEIHSVTVFCAKTKSNNNKKKTNKTTTTKN